MKKQAESITVVYLDKVKSAKFKLGSELRQSYKTKVIAKLARQLFATRNCFILL
jgi:hypothetical protein